MVKLTIRNLDDHVNQYIKNMAKEKNISANDLVKMILERSIHHELFKTYEEKFYEETNQMKNGFNELVAIQTKVIKKQDEVINKLNLLLDEL